MNVRVHLKACAALILVCLAGCRDTGKQQPAVGEAYAGPLTTPIRADTTPQSPVVATAKHGERVEILQEIRKMVLVRTSSGAQGWTDERQLLTPSDMAGLKQLGERAKRMPTQGQAITYGDIRVHIVPSYNAPSFLTLRANDKFDVLQYAVLPRQETAHTPLVPPASKKKVEPKKLPKNPRLLPPPPIPPPPGPPANWLELSRAAEPPPPPQKESQPAKPVRLERWCLIRTPEGQIGWILNSSLLTMTIPDEVAQYAEGHRIVSYFPLGAVQDKGQSKTIWLWTTASGPDPSFDFDSLRVFVWSLRRHRYETGHIERNLKGYLPVLLESVETTAGKRKSDTPKELPGFSVCIERKDGTRSRREYAFVEEKVRLVGERPCEPQPTVVLQSPVPVADAGKGTSEQTKETIWERVKKRWRALFH